MVCKIYFDNDPKQNKLYLGNITVIVILWRSVEECYSVT